MGYPQGPPSAGWGNFPCHLDGVPPTPGPGMGYPPPNQLEGVSPHLDLGSGTPLANWPDGVIPPPPTTNGEQTDIPKYKYYLPSHYVRRRL